MPPCDADPSLLRLVITNFIGNAYKFTATESEPVVEMGSMNDDGDVVYYVRDNGIGFDMDEADAVFEIF